MTGAPVRPELLGRKPYGAPQFDVAVRLNTNENPFAPPPAVSEAVAAAVSEQARGLNRYPDRDARALRAALAAYISNRTGQSIPGSMVWAANGSNEILQELFQAFGGHDRSALVFEPTYSMHRVIADATGTPVISLQRDENFAIEVGKARDEIERVAPALVIVCTPNNPTGTGTGLDDLRRMYEAVAACPMSVMVVDEAYAEFSGSPSAVRLLAGRPRLAVVRTMSKAFALAGARLGYLVADASIVDAVQLVRLPYHLSSLTQAAALAALGHAAELQAGVDELRTQRDRIVAFATARGLRVAGSEANFVLVGDLGDSASVWRMLLERGVLVRDVGIPGWLRVTAGTEQETSAFLAALSDILDTGSGGAGAPHD